MQIPCVSGFIREKQEAVEVTWGITETLLRRLVRQIEPQAEDNFEVSITNTVLLNDLIVGNSDCKALVNSIIDSLLNSKTSEW